MEPRCKVLVIDDDIDSQFALGAVLEFEGFEVASVAGGTDALRQLRDPVKRPEVVVLDIHLRDMSGLDVLRAIDEDATLASVGVVVVTGDRRMADVARTQGRRPVVDKPFSIGALLAAIDRERSGSESGSGRGPGAEAQKNEP